MRKYKAILYNVANAHDVVVGAAGSISLAMAKCGMKNSDIDVQQIGTSDFVITAKHDIYNNLAEELVAAKVNYFLYEIGNHLL